MVDVRIVVLAHHHLVDRHHNTTNHHEEAEATAGTLFDLNYYSQTSCFSDGGQFLEGFFSKIPQEFASFR